MEQTKPVLLYTKEGENLSEPIWDVYPRPQLKRDTFQNLNGWWKFAVTPDDHEPETYSRNIRVPFAPQAALSGIHESIPDGSTLWYQLTFELSRELKTKKGGKILLNIGAADQIATVILNGVEVGYHEGGYEHFSADLTKAIDRQGENVLTIKVYDSLKEFEFPYGKQSLNPGGMWYTPFSGIWQTVWLEWVPEKYLQAMSIETVESDVYISFEGIEEGMIRFPANPEQDEVHFSGGRTNFYVRDGRFWSPEDPYLYYFEIISGEDTVRSYFALRDLEIVTIDGIKRLCLNNVPYYFHGLLDQGYWSDGLVTPASPDSFTSDIGKVKALGFNTLRKHIKIEPEQFYYQCDVLGIIVFQDMVNNSAFSHFHDGVLPTIGLRNLNDQHWHRNEKARKAFTRGLETTVRQLRNHPCICLWTIFNEGWGQFNSDAMYAKLGKMDKTRFIDSASGWFACGMTDIESRHIYFKDTYPVKSDKPYLITEFGGYTWRPEGHCYAAEKTYGYGKKEDREELVKSVRKLYEEQVIPLVKKGLCGTIYTQVSDVEEEINGFMSYDRKMMKIKPEEFRDIGERLQQEIQLK